MRRREQCWCLSHAGGSVPGQVVHHLGWGTCVVSGKYSRLQVFVLCLTSPRDVTNRVVDVRAGCGDEHLLLRHIEGSEHLEEANEEVPKAVSKSHERVRVRWTMAEDRRNTHSEALLPATKWC